MVVNQTFTFETIKKLYRNFNIIICKSNTLILDLTLPRLASIKI